MIHVVKNHSINILKKVFILLNDCYDQPTLRMSFCWLLVMSISYSGLTLQAQQAPQLSLYTLNPIFNNPAYVGSNNSGFLDIYYRHHWANVTGAPHTAAISGHTSLGLRERVGIGGYLLYDKVHIHNNVSLSGAYSYRIELPSSVLSFGISTQLDYTHSAYTEVATNSSMMIDDNAFSENIAIVRPNFGLGTYYYHKNYYVGIALPQLLQFKDNNTLTQVQRIPIQYRNYILMAGGAIPLGSDKTVLLPAMLINTQPQQSNTIIDLSLSALLMDVFKLGAAARFTSGLGLSSSTIFTVLLLKNGIRIGYAHDIAIGAISQFSNGSHELLVGFNFKRDRGAYKERYYF